MEMELVSRETIKPSSPTPPELRTYQFSFLDNLFPPNAIPLLYFYPNESYQSDQETKISILKKSLSKLLTIYYPLAGRIKDRITIDCNDEGVSLLVTSFKIKLSEILQNPNEAFLNSLYPDELHWENMGENLVAIQINGFSCGGIATSVCISHKVSDVSTLAYFVNDWASLTRNWSSNTQEDGESPLPFPVPVIYANERDSPFPQRDFAVMQDYPFVKQNGVVCKRFVFEGSKIESLKAIAKSREVENPTRVEVVVALINKCGISAFGLTPSDAPLRITINFRKRMVPPLPDKSVGNSVWNFYVSNERVEKGNELSDMVRNIRTSLSEFCDKYVKNFGDSSFAYEFLKQASLPPKKKKELLGVDEKQFLFYVTSWCRFGAYEADFGWGKPMRVTSGENRMGNTIVLMDTKDGLGIEAILCMEEKAMALFERDEVLLQYASLDPNRWM